MTCKTVKNLSDIGPTWYFNVPKGYELLVTEMSKNTLLAKSFFKRIKLLVYSGASMPNHVFKQMEKLSVEYTGEKIFFLQHMVQVRLLHDYNANL